MGRSGFHMLALGSTRDDWIAVELSMDNEYAKPYFHQLHAEKKNIEDELGFDVEWREMPDKKTSRIRCYNNGMNPMDQDAWPEHFAWFQEKLEAFDSVFRPRIKNLNADDWDQEESLVDEVLAD